MPPCDYSKINRHEFTSRVSILVLVDAALRQYRARAQRRFLVVSILVLVDAALRPFLHVRLRSDLRCFNPCFSGCRPATIAGIEAARGYTGVSILVLVDAALRL